MVPNPLAHGIMWAAMSNPAENPCAARMELMWNNVKNFSTGALFFVSVTMSRRAWAAGTNKRDSRMVSNISLDA